MRRPVYGYLLARRRARVWTKTADYWAARWALTEAGKLRLEEAGLSIPFPHREIHIVGTAS
jgi:small conductance mechanosensitive channel